MLAGVLRAPPRRFACLTVIFCSLALGGCGWGDLGRLDRDVRASWSALTAADMMSADFAQRLVTARHGSIAHHPEKLQALSTSIRDIKQLLASPAFDLADGERVARYAQTRQRMVAALRDVFVTNRNRASGLRAWRSRGISRESAAHLMRAHAAAEAYDKAAVTYNRALRAGRSPISRALLYPGLRRISILGAERSRPDRLKVSQRKVE
ncbi:MAG: hypothetical protein K0U74_13350 [Alphaproteobacteria bacterium]|nr:hypothetical protein [Alphaproteobacteria bacterium]